MSTEIVLLICYYLYQININLAMKWVKKQDICIHFWVFLIYILCVHSKFMYIYNVL